MPRPHPFYVRIDTKKDTVEIDRGWPIEGHGSPMEVQGMLYAVLLPFVAQLRRMFPKYGSAIVECLRNSANAIEQVEERLRSSNG